MPTFTYNTVNNPMNPTTGKSLFYSFKVEGLGGNVKAITNVVEAKYFHPINHKRNMLAFHFVGSFATGYDGRVLLRSSGSSWAAKRPARLRYPHGDAHRLYSHRYLPLRFTYLDPTHLTLSGNATLRSTPPYPCSPTSLLSRAGTPRGSSTPNIAFPSLDRSARRFSSTPATYGILRKDQLQLNSDRAVQHCRIFPSFTNPALLIQPGTNFKLRASAGIEFVVQLPIINAPFRLYWAYNFDRLEQQIAAPLTNFQSIDYQNLRQSVGPSLWDSQVLPQLQNYQVNTQRINFFEPANTFRFTVSRTF